MFLDVKQEWEVEGGQGCGHISSKMKDWAEPISSFLLDPSVCSIFPSVLSKFKFPLSLRCYLSWAPCNGSHAHFTDGCGGAHCFPGGSVGKESACHAGDTWNVGSIAGYEDPLEEGMAIHSNILAGRIPWTEEPGGLQLMGLQRVGHMIEVAKHAHTLGRAQERPTSGYKDFRAHGVWTSLLT